MRPLARRARRRRRASTSSSSERLAKWVGFEKLPALHDRLPGDARDASSSLADKDTTLVLDAYSHACILDGTFLAAGVPKNAPEVRFFNHNSAKSLERILKTRERKNALVVVEGVYSLDGDTANLDGVRRHLRHATTRCSSSTTRTAAGTMGAHGRGTLEAMGLEGQRPDRRLDAEQDLRRHRRPALRHRARSSSYVKHTAR